MINNQSFGLLQIKPMVLTGFNRTSAKKNNIKNKVFCQSKITLGDGQISDIKHNNSPQ